jgi:hypothetical protein
MSGILITRWCGVQAAFGGMELCTLLGYVLGVFDVLSLQPIAAGLRLREKR